MKHIDILVHGLALFTGLMTALLGFLLYLKYRIKEIRHYTVFILSTTFTVAATTVASYLTYNINNKGFTVWYGIGFLLFELFLVFISYSFSAFALGIIQRPFTFIDKVLVGIPAVLALVACGIGIFARAGSGHQGQTIIPPIQSVLFMINLFFLFLIFVINSIRIAINLKNIGNNDLKRALKMLALLFIIYIPAQAVIILLKTQPVWILLSRNLFYTLVNITSIVFAAKYFFVQTPSIMDSIMLSAVFLNKYGITQREKEVIELLLGGLSIKEISAKLDRSFKTINNHIYNIYQKTGVGSKLELLNLIKENQI